MTSFIQSTINKILDLLLSKMNIPKSVSVIMDGNRRFAKKKKIEKIKGHSSGSDKLIEFTDWCLRLKVKELTVFAFAIDNFNRSKEEIDGLMNIFRDKFKITSEKDDENDNYFIKNGIKINIIGNRSMLESDIIEMINELEQKTSKNSSMILNICVAYNFSEEKSHVLEGVHKEIEEKLIGKDEIDKDFQLIFERNLYLNRNIKPDILIRTSGEVRLSNFLLYQIRFSQIYFIEKTWPELCFSDFIKVIFDFHFKFEKRVEWNRLISENDEALCLGEC